jgi:cytochrome c2
MTGTVLGVALVALAAGPAPPDNPLAGRSLFESKQCVACHGLAEGPGIAPNLGERRFAGSFLDLGAALWNHVPGMSVSVEAAGLPWPELSAEEAVELVAFLYFIEYLGRPGDAAAGQEVFEGKGCDGCHTLGEGETGVGPDLSELNRFASPLYIAQAIWNHGPSMFESLRQHDIEPPSFDEGDLADLAAFIRQKVPPVPQQRVLLAPGNPNRGGELFSAKGCAECHGSDARGDVGPDLAAVDLHRSAEGVAATMWNHALAMHTTMREAGLGWPSFTTTELADLVAFLYFLPFADVAGDAERGARAFSTHACAECHGVAEAEHAGPDLLETGVASSPEALVAAMWNHAPLMREAILAEGRRWPELAGQDLRDLFRYLEPPQDRGP